MAVYVGQHPVLVLILMHYYWKKKDVHLVSHLKKYLEYFVSKIYCNRLIIRKSINIS